MCTLAKLNRTESQIVVKFPYFHVEISKENKFKYAFLGIPFSFCVLFCEINESFNWMDSTR